ncbi:hypothetical protein VPHF99_0200 [Vibrio phage F99]|nr:hypothetical protein MYOV085v1_p0211 [Vibrio phage 355E48.1]
MTDHEKYLTAEKALAADLIYYASEQTERLSEVCGARRYEFHEMARALLEGSIELKEYPIE